MLIDYSFTHLHVASSYSLRYGTASPAALVARAAELGMPALALTDRDGLYGAFKHAQACAEIGLKPILGTDLALRSGGRVTLLAEGRQGWASLCHIVTELYATGEGANGEPVLGGLLSPVGGKYEGHGSRLSPVGGQARGAAVFAAPPGRGVSGGRPPRAGGSTGGHTPPRG